MIIGTISQIDLDAVTIWNAVLDLKGGDPSTLDNYFSRLSYSFVGNSGDDTFEAGIRGDELNGGDGSDTLIGGESSDIISGGAGADNLDGGLDSDFLDYGSSPGAVTINLDTGSASGGDATGDTFVNFEGVYGSAFGDTLTGSSTGERFRGRDGVDVIDGGAG